MLMSCHVVMTFQRSSEGNGAKDAVVMNLCLRRNIFMSKEAHLQTSFVLVITSEVVVHHYAKLPSGLPSPSTTGYPTNLTCSNIQYYYEDLEFELCGAGVKVHRKWYIIDWCTGAERLAHSK